MREWSNLGNVERTLPVLTFTSLNGKQPDVVGARLLLSKSLQSSCIQNVF
jgi:hypothetical protein